MKLNFIDDVTYVPVQRLRDDRGLMTVVSERDVPIKIVRIFNISSKNTDSFMPIKNAINL